MSDLEDIKAILTEMRDNQKTALEQQAAQVALAREQVERSRQQIEESLGLQREALGRQRTITRIAVPAILLCIALILYLLVRYF